MLSPTGLVLFLAAFPFVAELLHVVGVGDEQPRPDDIGEGCLGLRQCRLDVPERLHRLCVRVPLADEFPIVVSGCRPGDVRAPHGSLDG